MKATFIKVYLFNSVLLLLVDALNLFTCVRWWRNGTINSRELFLGELVIAGSVAISLFLMNRVFLKSEFNFARLVKIGLPFVAILFNRIYMVFSPVWFILALLVVLLLEIRSELKFNSSAK